MLAIVYNSSRGCYTAVAEGNRQTHASQAHHTELLQKQATELGQLAAMQALQSKIAASAQARGQGQPQQLQPQAPLQQPQQQFPLQQFPLQQQAAAPAALAQAQQMALTQAPAQAPQMATGQFGSMFPYMGA